MRRSDYNQDVTRTQQEKGTAANMPKRRKTTPSHRRRREKKENKQFLMLTK